MNDEQLVELAENANTYTPLGAGDVRVANDRYVIWMGRGDEPGWNVAQRFRLQADEVEVVRAELHEILRKRGRTGLTWEVGTHATPGDLTERLLALGLVDDEPTPLAVGMVLTEPPAAPPPDVEVRRPQTPEEWLASSRIAAIAFGGPEPTEPRLPTTMPTTSSTSRSSTARRSRGPRPPSASVPSPSSAARRCRKPAATARTELSSRPGGRMRLPRDAGARHAGKSHVTADPHAPRFPRGLRDPHPARQVRVGDSRMVE